MDAFQVPAEIAALGLEAVEHVEALVGASEEREAVAVAAAVAHALRAVPWPLRGLVRKVLFP